jgi:TetR/AcrR family transcriptional regulator, transcriptional repressor for nem operon
VAELTLPDLWDEMRKSKADTELTRRKIVETAAREFQRKGIQGTGLTDLMAAAGLTHGGFYRHFASKDQLVAEACAEAMRDTSAVLSDAASEAVEQPELQSIIEKYLDVAHRDDCGGGCPLASLGSELARADINTREVVSEGFNRLVDMVAATMRRRNPEAARSDAIFATVALVGAVTMSRVVTDPDLSNEILEHTAAHLG